MGKRPPPPQSVNRQNKVQRNYHIANDEAEYYEKDINAMEIVYDQTWDEYLAQAMPEQEEQQETVELSEINFLE